MAQPEAAKPAANARYEAAADYSAGLGGRAVLVMIDGKVVYERYDNGWSASKMHPLASGTKSFAGVVAAAAVDDGLLKWDELACDTLTEWKADPRKSKITVRHLLSLSSGLEANDPALESKGANPLLGPGTGRDKARGRQEQAKDKFAFAVAAKAVHDPGTVFEYGPTHYYAFGALLERKIKARHAADPKFPDSTYMEYMKRRVLDPIGLNVGWWVKDATGHPNLPGGCLLTAREWAKFGELVRLEGQWPGEDGALKRIVSKEALAECFKPSPTNKGYGLTWWLLNGGDEGAAEVADGGGMLAKIKARRMKAEVAAVEGMDGVPKRVYMAAGLGKQRL